ncbi:glycosyltransferase, partial [bacterium]|nr:glycosyltransferase [bacterium]
MKILYIITGLRFGGAEKLLYLTCKQLSEKYAAEIRVIYFDPYAPMRFLFAGINVQTELFRRNLALLPRLLLHIRREKYDVVHTHLIHADIYGRLAALLAGPTASPVIFSTVHGLDWFRWQKGLYFSLVRRIDYWLSLPRRNYVIAISQSVRNLLIEKQKFSANKIVLLYNAIEVTSDAASKPSHTKVIRCLYLGRFVKVKNIPCLIHAM